MTFARHTVGTLCRWLRPTPPAGGYPSPDISPEAWQSVIALANAHLLVPALCAALKHSGQLSAVPPEPRRYLVRLHRLNRRRNILIRRQTLELVEALNEVSVVPLLLKGALVLTVDPATHRGGRMMADIDFAVPPEVAGTTSDVLARLDYTLRNRYPDGHHAYGEFGRSGSPAALDLHFELIDQHYLLPAREVWDRGWPVKLCDAVFRMPGMTDRVFHNLLHAQIHHVGNFYRAGLNLRDLLEFATMVASNGSRIDWQRLQTTMAAHGLTGALDNYLLASHRLFGTPWPFDRRPLLSGRFHLRLGVAQLRRPFLSRLFVPAGNVRAAFSRHRMQQLYDHLGGGPILWRWHHLRQFLSRHGARPAIGRLFRFW